MIGNHNSLASIALTALIAFMPTIASAQSPVPSNAELQRQIAILKAKVEQLQRENQQLKSLDEQVEAIQQKLKTQETQARGQAKSLPVVDASSQGLRRELARRRLSHACRRMDFKPTDVSTPPARSRAPALL